MGLVDALSISEESSRKQEEYERKLRMVETDLERISDKAEEFESKGSMYGAKLEADSTSLKNMETRAEFSERTVEKLEQQVDNITDGLYQEKVAFNEMSKKLDQTLNDMMNI